MRPHTPDTYLDPDVAGLRALAGNGADLAKSTHVLFYVYAPTETDANRVAERGADGVVTATVRASGSGDGTWLCLFEGDLVPNAAAIRDYRARFEALAAAEGGDYDGWEAALTK